MRRMLLSACLALAACGSAATRAALEEGQELWCEGTPVLVIRNNTTYEVEVVEVRSGSGRRVTIATVGPGRTEVNIRPERDYAYAVRRVRDGRWITGEGWTGGSTLVSLERECR